jgi:hypothetical protein
MSQTIFISHAGADAAKAAIVAGHLKDAGIDARFDRAELLLGDSFISFMESALEQSDYCLLLWSQKASLTPWVKVEWESAFYKSVQEKRSFLVTGRLEDFALPALLGPRLMVDLFPDFQPGVGQLIDTWKADRAAEQQTNAPVAGGKLVSETADETSTLYLDSAEFGITLPMKVDLNTPAGVYLDRLIQAYDLPTILDYKGRSGVKYAYSFVLGQRGLERGKPLASQGVGDKSIVTLETKMTPFSQTSAVSGSLGDATFRDGEEPKVMSLARAELLDRIVRNGLGP